ncbi:oxidoreductase [Umezawaea beigongshangensis]|uniref:oxidoreductase n=1 Tax=Umezawaea beigongshangensis TaxID=2780383 RepID=UPI0018F10D67|nr:oxidoreductase [Umezawaea beigongshangensis]
MSTQKWTAADLPDLSGTTFVVTGATAGLGLATTRELARAGAHVVMAVRDEAKGAEVARTIAGDTEVRRLDVSSLASVRAFAGAWTGRLDVLINNAGIMLVPLSRTGEGHELQMATNYFGPHALTNLLLPHITDRVVTLSSQLHRIGRARADDLDWHKRRYRKLGAYADSKLDLALFGLELQRKLEAIGSPVRSVLAHPGIATTTLASHAGGLSGRINNLAPLLNDVEHGALPTLYAATGDVPGGSYVGPDGFASVKGHPAVRKPSRRARNARTAAELWSATAAITGVDFAVTAGG